MKNNNIEIFLGSITMTIVEAMQKIDKNTKGILFIVDDKRKLAGSLTDGDIRRWLIKTGSLNALISEAMNHEPCSIKRSEVGQAINIMRSKSIFALPVLNELGIVEDVLFESGKLEKAPAYCIVYCKRVRRTNAGIERCHIFGNKRKIHCIARSA